MSDRLSSFPNGLLSGWLRGVLILTAIAGLITAATLIPALSSNAPIPTSTNPGGDGGTGLPQFGGGNGTNSDKSPKGLNTNAETSIGSGTNTDSIGAASRRSQPQTTSPHFTAESSRPMYWRTDAYQNYTGNSWERSTQTSPTNGRLGTKASEDSTFVQQTITLNKSATSLPTAWKPVSISTQNANTDLRVTETGSVQSSEPLPAGTTYTVTSRKTQPDPDTLRKAGRNYPSSIEKQYTQLPSSTSQNVTSFTSNLTANDDNPYEKAVTIEQWLEENKEYSPNATTDSDQDVASQFIFEKNTGTSKHYATSMAVMLRSQGIPARYATGYSPGTQTNDSTYTVRGTNKHAWTEVYFPETGWVRFDPTPQADRRAAEQKTLKKQTGEQKQFPEVSGSPSEDDSSTLYRADPPYNIQLHSSATPGTTVTVTVTKGSTPVQGVIVEFNGDAVGKTNSNGNTTGTVPYTQELNVTVHNPEADEGTSALSAPGTVAGQRDTSRFYSVRSPKLASVQSQNNSSTKTYDVESNFSITFKQTPAPGAQTTLVVTINGHPVTDGVVLLDGERAGTTDSNGELQVSIPGTGQETVNVTARRGELSSTETIPLATIDLTVSHPLVLGFPGQEATITTTAGGEPISDVPITLNGDQIGTTDANGTVSATYPVAWDATLSGSAYGQTATHTTALGLHLTGVLAAGIGLLGGIAYYLRRKGVTLTAVLEALSTIRTVIGDAIVTALVAATDRLELLKASLRNGLGRLHETIIALPNRLRSRLAGVSFPSIKARLHQWLTHKWLAIRTWVRERAPEQSQHTDTPHTHTSQSHLTHSREAVRQAWRALAKQTNRHTWRQKTPGEIARNARSRGLPNEPVETLTNLFREVEYGTVDADEDDVQTATNAANKLNSTTEGDD